MDPVCTTTLSATDPAAKYTQAVSWPAIIAGTTVAVAAQVALSHLCLGLGLSLWDFDEPVANIAVGTGLAWVLCGLVSLFLGGWVAGRLTRRRETAESLIHGAMVWAVTAVVGTLLAVTAAGALAGGAATIVAKTVGGGVEAATAVATMGTPEWNTVKDQLEKAITTLEARAVPTGPVGGDNRMADRSRLMELLAKNFTLDTTTTLSAVERDELMTLIARQTGVTPEAANKAYAQWQRQWSMAVERYEAMKIKARETARQAKNRTAQAAIWTFLASLLGVTLAALGGYCGGRCAQRCGERTMCVTSAC